jgi:hypothetical protein
MFFVIFLSASNEQSILYYLEVSINFCDSVPDTSKMFITITSSGHRSTPLVKGKAVFLQILQDLFIGLVLLCREALGSG